ncbi:hypothetical protein [Curtobacterium sp. MCBA15_004]|uniref:hypothetical protein n=1 Tax=Curtobacterium sp. MCBA15_004 TaxID=1898733 RepID=UPI0008DDDE45|nr:hypothetical protein [Curtobacterium sp. MCBA15_004]WIA96444.1 hypothetical protein QOL16_15300 [Curtobacterium sp. MCBA15_004]
MSRRGGGSAAVGFGLELYKQIRAEFEEHRTAAYEAALEACRGHLLNERGRKAGIDAWDLFIGNEARARAYASEELLEHWTKHPRVTVAAYERQVLDRHLYESGVAA